jgi:cytochrome c peroxidase
MRHEGGVSVAGGLQPKAPRRLWSLALLSLLAVGMMARGAWALPVTDLNAVPTPGPSEVNLGIYVKGVALHPVPNVRPLRNTIYPDKLIALGKALFWDLQVGSDGRSACASCHFKGGADDRMRNTLVPGQDGVFQPTAGMNSEVQAHLFPFHRMANPMNRGSGGLNPNDPAVLKDTDDVVGSQGVAAGEFVAVLEGRADEAGRPIRGRQALNGRNIRQVTGRQAPPAINAVFNQANFWDGRAHNVFNGVDPFGPLSFDARVKMWNCAEVVDFNMLDPANVLVNSSLASQSTGPVLSEVEMSWAGRSWPEVGRKLLNLQPLAGQLVHPQDSIFGYLRMVDADGKGLSTTYGDLIRQVFQEMFWNTPAETRVLIDGKEFTLMEANFSLFWGLALQAYQSTLVSDDSPVDRFQRNDPLALAKFSAPLRAATGIAGLDAAQGKLAFESLELACSLCHTGAETTAAAVGALLGPLEGAVELMPTQDGKLHFYDIGFYNIGLRPSAEDLGRGGMGPNGIPLAFARHRNLPVFPTGFDPTVGGSFALNVFCDPLEAAAIGAECPAGALGGADDNPGGEDQILIEEEDLAVTGAFKTPHLRNVELTGPYFHNGGMVNLMQVVEFYTRGGDFFELNRAQIPLDFSANLPSLNDGGDRSKLLLRQNLVAFLLALTDERVRQEAAPFDHPQFFYPEGHENVIEGNPKTSRTLKDIMVEIPATSMLGRNAAGIAPLMPSFSTDCLVFHFQPSL